MSKIQWEKEDVIKRFQEAMAPQGKPDVLQGLLDRAKIKKPGEVEQPL